MFFDPGSQVSFVSTALVNAIGAPTVGSATVSLNGFGSAAKPTKANICALTMVDKESCEHTIHALQHDNLGLDLPRISCQTVQRWEEKGVQLSDKETHSVSSVVHVLVGADYSNKFLHRKKLDVTECAWETDFGWVLSGISHDQPQKSDSLKVAFVQSSLDCSWEMETPVEQSNNWPAFPMTSTNGRYTVGLLWRSEERPLDNRKQALASANSQVRRLSKRSGAREQYDDGLLKEYQDLGAVERELEPEKEGYYLPHHAVFKEDSTTTKLRVVFNAAQ